MTSDRHNHSDTKQANCQIKYRLVHTTFAIGWKGRYRLEGPAFIYTD